MIQPQLTQNQIVVGIMSATIVFIGRIYRVLADEGSVWAECCAVKDDKIIYVGNKEGAKEFIGITTQVINIPEDGLLLPGFRMFSTLNLDNTYPT